MNINILELMLTKTTLKTVCRTLGGAWGLDM